MLDDLKTIYGDGTRSVVVTNEQVIVREQYTDVDDTPSYRMIAFSHAAWREITLGWQRFQQEEGE
jgi:uncharacterized protein (DUF736 family)